jgi:cell division transport system permease protein
MKEKANLLFYAFKYTFLGMIRHWVLCLSAITTTTITLILVAVFVLTGIHGSLFASGMASELSIHAVATADVQSEEDIASLQQILEGMTNVSRVEFSSKEQELENMIAEKGEAFAIYREDNPLSNAFFVYVDDEEELERTANIIEMLPQIESTAYGGSSVQSLVQILDMVRKVCFALAVFMMVLSLYLIYNTIRTTIYSRREEISVMKTVGATAAFIRIPFEMEGVLIGLLGAVIPFAAIAAGYPLLYTSLSGRLFISEFTLLAPDQLIPFCALLLFGLGALSGLFASALAAGLSLRKVR